MRDDDLYTGVSADEMFSNEKPSEPQSEELMKQLAEVQRILPSSEWMLETINAERNAICDLRAYMKTLGDRPQENQIQDEYRARELYMGFLDRLEGEITNKISTAKEVPNV